MPIVNKAAKPEAKVVPVQPTAAAAPIAEPVETAVSPVTGNVSSDSPTPPPSTSPSTNGALELVAIADQLSAVQSLMEMAQAKSVQVSGTIRLNLVVEIEL